MTHVIETDMLRIEVFEQTDEAGWIQQSVRVTILDGCISTTQLTEVGRFQAGTGKQVTVVTVEKPEYAQSASASARQEGE